MNDYDFNLKFKLPGATSDMDDLTRRLRESGCEDALLGIGQPGRIALQFTREAPSAARAITSALEDVKRAIPRAKLIEAGPDFVGLTEVADFVGVSRQNMRSLMLRHASSFPAPVHEGSPSIWHLVTVLQWLRERGGYDIEQSALDVARATMQINIARDAKALTPKTQRALRSLVD